jgi:hypothetical protein
VLAAVLALPVSAGAQLPVGAKMEGVEHVRNIPVNGSVGANFKGKYMFVTGTLGSPKTDPGLTTQMNYGGLWVYDVSDADDPELVSHLPVPHYENEDVSIGGNRLLISGDGTFGGSNLVVVDISNPRVPAIEQVVNMQLVDEGHTATCVQECRYAWVAGGGSIAVLRLDENAQFENAGAAPDVQIQGATSRVEAGDLPVYREFGWSTHDVQVDEAGYAWVVGGHGTIAFDTRPGSYGEANLLNPAVVARTGPDALNDEIDCGDSCNKGETVNDFIHHNSWRPDADRFRSRRDRDLRQRGVRPGETVLITEEDIWSRATGATKGGCENQGSFQTWQVKQLKATDENESTVKHLDSFTTEFNELLAKEDDVEGMDLIPTNGFCSAHYFDERDGFVATAWYEQGTRLLDVRDPTNIKQVGYFMAPDSVVWAAYWAPTDRSIIYVMDHQRGIDVLEVEWPRRHWGDRDRDDDRDRDREDRWESKRVRAPAVPSWFRQGTKLSRTRLAVDQGRPHKGFGWVCRIR